MKDKLISFIKSLQTDRPIVSFDEAATKNALVLRLLFILGWDPFNIQEVRPEYTVAGKRVDYALRLSDFSKVFIEVKRIGEQLDRRIQFSWQTLPSKNVERPLNHLGRGHLPDPSLRVP